MASDVQQTARRIPTLVQYCQRVASIHVDSIKSLGHDLRFDLIKPILESCTPEILYRLEQSSPHIRKDTESIWKDICFRCFLAVRDQYMSGCVEPESWRKTYIVLRDAEAKRVEEVGSRIRNQRLELEERKKDREIKYTDRVPPTKRSRTAGWTSNGQSKTLFQKTRTEASKIQKALYNARPILPNTHRKDHAGSPSAVKVTNASAVQPSTRVKVRTVTIRRPSTSSTSTASSTTSSGASNSVWSGTKAAIPKPAAPSRPGPTPAELRPLKPPGTAKKDPMAGMFMPKHRAHSQLPPQLSGFSHSPPS